MELSRMLAAALCPLIISCAMAAEPRFAVGSQTRAFSDDDRRNWQNTGARPVMTVIWYPIDAKLKRHTTADPDAHFVEKSVIPQAPILPTLAKCPMLVLSHGASGHAHALLWFAHYFAERGYIVAAVTHHGDTWMESDRPPPGRLHFWERPGDLTVALNQLMVDPVIAPRIDPTRIGAAGYSAGGGTVIQLAGAVFRPDELNSICQTDPARAGCDIPPFIKEQLSKIDALAKVDPVVRASIARRDRSFKDERIKAAFAIAPALGRIFTENGLSAVNIPIAIVASRADKIAPPALDSYPYAQGISSARLTLISEHASHFAFGNECTPLGQRTENICKEPAGVDRAALHRAVGALAYEFFEDVWRENGIAASNAQFGGI